MNHLLAEAGDKHPVHPAEEGDRHPAGRRREDIDQAEAEGMLRRLDSPAGDLRFEDRRSFLVARDEDCVRSGVEGKGVKGREDDEGGFVRKDRDYVRRHACIWRVMSYSTASRHWELFRGVV